MHNNVVYGSKNTNIVYILCTMSVCNLKKHINGISSIIILSCDKKEIRVFHAYIYFHFVVSYIVITFSRHILFTY